MLWLLLKKLKLTRILATQAMLTTVITIAGLCDAIQDDTGLVAAIDLPEDRPFLKTIVQLAIGILFISISATVTPASLRGVIWPSLALIALLVLVVRPAGPGASGSSSGPWTPGASSRLPRPRASPPRSSHSASAGASKRRARHCWPPQGPGMGTAAQWASSSYLGDVGPGTLLEQRALRQEAETASEQPDGTAGARPHRCRLCT